ncbi:GntR family transcriptional regulator [Ferrovibrio sp.]|uniref:GntR family transcriptional regulator n=1 Tax=Ferrovibrio sp. TaxID=1917215 RepID=UPI0025BF1CD3|nr:GntR family transcriptional regulator [Ferrovibrio sp.]MBX3453023.1 GntR family transcriptional regulator [Ferrovibrio sp.]
MASADEAIYREIADAILQGRLKAGTKLPEHKLAAIFGVSRERIRKLLHRLAAERRLEIIPNRGCFVPRPSVADVRMIYEAHRVFEAGVIEQLLRRLDDRILQALDAHLAQEREAAGRGDRAASVRLSGAFHLLLTDSLGNAELSRFLRELLSRSSLMVSVYEPAQSSVCAVDEHAGIVQALRQRDLATALRLSREHFTHIENRLNLEHAGGPDADLAALFASREP